MLNKKQRRFLFKLAQPLKATHQIGKEGITDSVSASILVYIKKHELMKVSILPNATSTTEEVTKYLNEYSIETVGVIGRVMILYKANKKLLDSIKIENIK